MSDVANLFKPYYLWNHRTRQSLMNPRHYLAWAPSYLSPDALSYGMWFILSNATIGLNKCDQFHGLNAMMVNL